MKGRLVLAALLSSVLALIVPRSASATQPYVERPITLPGKLSGSVDLGVGYGHLGSGSSGLDGVGFSMEGVLGIRGYLDIGLRIGLRPGRESPFTQSDYYGRMFDREAFWMQGVSAAANPELRVRGRVVEKGPLQMALEARLLLPVSQGTGLMLGAPLQVSLERTLKIETGVYVPIGFYDSTAVGLHLPLRVNIQLSDKGWIGPSTALRFASRKGKDFSVPIGIGGGYSLSQIADLKGELYLTRINDGLNAFGMGVGVGFLLL
jgi:hypothetical protein